MRQLRLRDCPVGVRSGGAWVGLALLIATVTGCSAVEQPDPPSLATDRLSASVEEVVGIPVTVTCPPDIPIKAGLVTECVVSDGTQSKVLVVTQTDDQGTTSWEISEKDAPAE